MVNNTLYSDAAPLRSGFPRPLRGLGAALWRTPKGLLLPRPMCHSRSRAASSGLT